MCAGLAAALGLAASAEAGAAELLTRTPWGDTGFPWGGVSGIEITGDGGWFYALADNGVLTWGPVRRDAEGRITYLVMRTTRALKGPDGAPIERPDWKDSEGIALTGDGGLVLSFEFTPRVWRYAGPEAAAEPLPVPREFHSYRGNKALELVAVAADGTIFTIPERPLRRNAPHPVFRFRNGRWDVAFDYEMIRNFRPVGADFDDMGRLYVLERRFDLPLRFSTRVRRFTEGPEGGWTGETILETAPGTHDNMEGLAVWRDGAGAIRLVMVEDDNFHDFLRGEVVEYRLPLEEAAEVR